MERNYYDNENCGEIKRRRSKKSHPNYQQTQYDRSESYHERKRRIKEEEEARRIRKSDTGVPFFTEEDYDPTKLRLNIREDFTVDRPKPKTKKRYKGATFEADRTGFTLSIHFG